MQRFIRVALFAMVLTSASGRAHAQIAMSGARTATQACPALQSIRKGTNPGEVTLQPGQTYRVLGKNKEAASHYLVAIEAAQPAQRWVAVGCGQIAGGEAAGAAPAAGTADSGARATHVLALSWEPAFCAAHGDKAECAAQTAQSPDATQLSLHGLWPQPRGKFYCNVDPALRAADQAHDWASLPEPELSPPTRQRLAAVMPGLRSGLQRHEWIVHGTCFGGPADAYFARAAALTEQVNATPVRETFARAVGQSLSSDQIRAAFDAAYGAGAGARVTVNCQGRGPSRRISEIVVSLAGDVQGAAPIGDLIRAAAPVPPGCPSGVVALAAR